jgi:hypothetical protein
MWKEFFEELGWARRYVAVWAFGWVYRGFVEKVGDQAILLDDVCAVEETGPATDEKPKQETPVPSKMLISFDAVENVCIPTWASYNAKIKEEV